VLEAISAEPSMAFFELCRYRCRGSDHLIAAAVICRWLLELLAARCHDLLPLFSVAVC
jgi:hypothetical protein